MTCASPIFLIVINMLTALFTLNIRERFQGYKPSKWLVLSLRTISVKPPHNVCSAPNTDKERKSFIMTLIPCGEKSILIRYIFNEQTIP